ncbi:UDP-glucose 4-epimerase GalE [Bacillus sp. BP-3]|uniref:UDP-glucose 4-epimerase GalE n=1 Tax=Bacillus sp. BP-3 TaxID=3022773 RepID=UPI00232ACBB6|nr:UDP-glucose 4-epimerase GalE [Bacillus sp. BP-3]MDC2866140.1 UDP-glucose 4-epimerase GalE [Bacillus sp. BP-3]
MILVVGGAGYIGSHTVKQLLDQKFEVVVLDNLSTGHRESVDERATLEVGDLSNAADLDRVFSSYSIDAVMHFAANSLVGESVSNPLKYYKNNVSATITLLEKMMEHGITSFIFSSTAATYGIPETDIITEKTATNPINTYGRTKLMVEHILQDFHAAYGMKYVVLRYFNAAGAHVSGTIGEDHTPETHLIPLVLQHLLGKRESISVFGTDYDTHDGTCIRDYIHVTDLAEAHILALQSLQNEQKTNEVFNLGNGKGFSVKEVIETCERVTEKKANVIHVERRAGDPAQLIASSEKIYNELGWKAKYSLEEMIQTAWEWHTSHPNGYSK